MSEAVSETDELPEEDQRILKRIFGKQFGTETYSKEQIQLLANAHHERLLKREYLFFRKRKKGEDDSIVNIHYSWHGQEASASATQLLMCTRGVVVMTGGGNVSRHQEKCSAKKSKKAESASGSQRRIDGFMASVSVQGTLEEQQQISTVMAKWVATSSRPFSIAEDSGLKELISVALRIGARRRNVDNLDVSSIIPTRQTVTNRLNTLQSDLLAKSGAEVVNHLATVGGAFPSDYGKRKDDYLTLVVHVVYNWRYYSIHAAMRRCDVARKDNVQVWTDIVQAGKSFGLTDAILRQIFSASDEGSNITKALRLNNKKNVNCICHMANNLCKRTFSPYKDRRGLLFENDLTDEDKSLVQRGRRLLSELKLVVNGIRGSEVGQSLRRQLPLEVETRWLSKLRSAKAFRECADELYKYKDRGKLPENVKQGLRYLYDHSSDFDDVYNILLQFEEIVQFFQRDTAVIYEVWPRWNELKESLSQIVMTSDSSMQTSLARSAYKCMLRKEDDGVISMFHKMATFLHPKRRQLRRLADEAERREVIMMLKELVCEVEGGNDGASQPKAPKLPRTDYDDLDDSGGNVATEVDSYLNASFNFLDPSGNPHDNPLIAWKERAPDFPVLSRVVQQIYSIPASTATAERSFSDLRNLVPDKRESLSAESVFKSLIIRSLMKFEAALNSR